MSQLYRYSVRYRRNTIPGRVYRMTVTASDPDDARGKVAIRDPQYLSTVETPKRRAFVDDQDQRCRFCHRYVVDGGYQRVSFPDGVSNVCDVCFEHAYDEDRYATWRDTEVEVV